MEQRSGKYGVILRHITSAAILGLSLVFLSSCDQTAPSSTDEPLRVNAAIAAVVNDEFILASEVELEAAAQGLLDVGERLEVDDPQFGRILEQLIDQKLLAQEALALGLDQEESARHRLHAARERILGNLLVEQLVAQEVDEGAVLKMYQAQAELQQLGEEVLVAHIQLRREEEANEIYEDLTGGAEFAELAFRYSEDKVTSAEGGMIGYRLPEEFSDSFMNVINRTAVGAISKPFESDVGWHIIKIDDRRVEEPPSLDETRPKIVQFLTLSEISKVIERLRTRSDIQTITGDNPIDVLDIANETVVDEIEAEVTVDADIVPVTSEETPVDAPEYSAEGPVSDDADSSEPETSVIEQVE